MARRGSYRWFCLSASRNAATSLELVKELLHQVPRPIQMLVIVTRLFAAGLRRNYNAFARNLQGIDDPRLGIVSSVGDSNGRRRARQ